uniref:Protein yellow n=1 Tax=Schizaphis graminum TaxID=13262 RepID=A0A2S2PAI7_SCHGA
MTVGTTIFLILLARVSWLAAAAKYGTFLLSGSNLEWPSVTEESSDILYGRYEPRKILVHGFQMDDERAYVTMPRFAKSGVPWSLGVFRLDVSDFEPDIRPYPDYGNHGSRCGGGRACMVNVIDVYIETGVLWALDTGTVNVLWKPLRLGPAQLIAVNLTTDAVIGATDLSTVTWPDSVVEHVVAARTSCGRLHVYVSDVGRHKIIVYDVDARRLHTIRLPETIPVECHRRAVLYLAPVTVAGRAYVYFTYRHSGYVYALDAWSQESVAHGAVFEVGVKPVVMHVLGSDRGTNVYFRTASGGTDVWSWDVNRPLEVRSFVLVHRSYLYLTPTAVVAGWRDAVWTVESNYDEYTAGNVDCTGPRTLLRPLNGGGAAADDCNEIVLQ